MDFNEKLFHRLVDYAADEAERLAGEERERADEAEKRAALAEENSIRQLVELSQKLGASMDATVQNLMEQKGLSREASLEKTRLCWKDNSVPSR